MDPRREAREVSGSTRPTRPLRFGFLSEADPRPGQTYGQRYRDLFEEVILAEQLGFDVFGLSEQHFALGVASVSCIETKSARKACALRRAGLVKRRSVISITDAGEMPVYSYSPESNVGQGWAGCFPVFGVGSNTIQSLLRCC